MPDYTGYGGPRADPTADINGVPFSTLDTLGRRGGPSNVLVTVAPGRAVKTFDGDTEWGLAGVAPAGGLSQVNAEFAASQPSTAWLLLSDAIAQRRDGFVTF